MKQAESRRKAGYTLRQRFDYWFDNRMAKGSLGIIRALIVATILLAVVIAGLIILFGFNEEGEVGSVFWDSITTVINAWMPSYEDGSPGYVVLMTVSALAGVLFTSVLIGIVTSSIEEKITDLKKGNSLVLERDHTVVLGYSVGEYTLIRQLILAAAGKPSCLLLAEDMDREEMEQDLQDNLDVPKNFRIVCRTVDITDPTALGICAIPDCRTVIVSPMEDTRATKTILAVSALMQQQGVTGIRVNAIVSKNEYRFPPSLAKSLNISTLQTNDIMAKMIAHSCTQTGLSETFREIFNFEGSEMYVLDRPETVGWRFEELTGRMAEGIPIGVLRGGKTILSPAGDMVLQKGDRLIAFAEESDTPVLEPDWTRLPDSPLDTMPMNAAAPSGTVIIGHNETLPVILRELPEDVNQVLLANPELTHEERQTLESVAVDRGLVLRYFEGNPRTEEGLEQLARWADHVVILGSHDLSPEEADMAVTFLLLNLRDLRTRLGLKYNITVEMQKEHNQKLIAAREKTDFLVTSSMASLILAQLAESPELIDAFRELLSNEGSEVYLKNAAEAGLAGEFTVQTLRSIVLRRGYVFLGYTLPDGTSVFNPPLHETVTLGEEHSLIVLGDN